MAIRSKVREYATSFVKTLLKGLIFKFMNFVYILASQRNGTLYIGVTSNIAKRIYEHKNDIAEGFTKKYKVHRLVYIEETTDVNAAILREKQLIMVGKNWTTNFKI